MSDIELRNITKSFGNNLVVQPTNLRIEHGELVTLLGPSGSGKSTLLSIIAGLLTPCEGQILIGGKDVTRVPPAKRNLGMVFQNYALFPHMTVFENVAFPLSIRGLSKADIDSKVKRALEMVRLDGLAKRKQSQISGGQQQRVALARALVFEPEILLLDEPMGALDKKLREEVQLELRQLQRNLGVTTILVTHDQEEALSLSTRLVVIDAGQVQQVTTPELAYKEPANKFVAEFIGTANLWPGNALLNADGTCVEFAAGGCFQFTLNKNITGPVHLLVRPEHLEVHNNTHKDGVAAKITEIIYLGQSTRIHMKTESGMQIVAASNSVKSLLAGQEVCVSWKPENAWLMPA